MSKIETLKALRERVLAATGHDDNLCDAIATALDDWMTGHTSSYDQHSKPETFHHRDDYSDSIDAALALVERVLPGWDICLSHGHGEPWESCIAPPDRAANDIGHAPTLPLAILAALLSALIAKEGAA